MAQGLQIWDATSKKILDSSLQTSSILGTVDITEVGTQVITDSRFSWGTPFFFSDSFYAGSTIKGVVSGTQLTISVTSAATDIAAFKPLRIYYGVF